MEKLVEELTEQLENVAAALDTVLAHYGSKMTTADRLSRQNLVARSRGLVKRARKELKK